MFTPSYLCSANQQRLGAWSLIAMLSIFVVVAGPADARDRASEVAVNSTGIAVPVLVTGTINMRLAVSSPYCRTIFMAQTDSTVGNSSLFATAPDGYDTCDVLINAGSKVLPQSGVIFDSTLRKSHQRKIGFLEHFGSMFTAAVTKVFDALVPMAVGAPITGNHITSDGTVGGWFGINHSDGEAPEYHLHIQGDSVEPNPFLGFEDFSGSDWWDMGIFNGLFFIEHDRLQTDPFIIVGTSLNDLSFLSDSNGDVSFADDAVFVDRDAIRLGVGTITPTSPIHVMKADGTAQVLVQGTTARWGLIC
jgi:hypothetical protein